MGQCPVIPVIRMDMFQPEATVFHPGLYRIPQDSFRLPADKREVPGFYVALPHDSFHRIDQAFQSEIAGLQFGCNSLTLRRHAAGACSAAPPELVRTPSIRPPEY